jgi:hypothetical protein
MEKRALEEGGTSPAQLPMELCSELWKGTSLLWKVVWSPGRRWCHL